MRVCEKGHISIAIPKDGVCSCGEVFVPVGGMNMAPNYPWDRVRAKTAKERARLAKENKRRQRRKLKYVAQERIWQE